MQDNKQPIKGRDVIIIGIFSALFMLSGSVWDYPISQALYNPNNPFGIFFASFGELPASVGLLFAGMMLLRGHNRDRAKRAAGARQIIGGLLLCAVGGGMLLIIPGHYLPVSRLAAALIGGAIGAVAVPLSLVLCRRADRVTMLRIAAVLVMVIAAELLTVNVLKVIWERPRMRLMAQNSAVYFRPWWVIGGELKDKLTAAGIAADEFKSFPSAHTSSGAVMMLLALLPRLTGGSPGKGRVLFYIGAGWGGLVALSRIIMGAHFVTDTTVGFTVTLLLVWLTVTKIFNKSKQ